MSDENKDLKSSEFCSLSETPNQELKTAWFTFGQAHAHQCGKHLLNKDTVLEITALDPRAKMFELFGNKWSMEYDQPPDMIHFPKGIIKL